MRHTLQDKNTKHLFSTEIIIIIIYHPHHYHQFNRFSVTPLIFLLKFCCRESHFAEELSLSLSLLDNKLGFHPSLEKNQS